MVIVVRVVDILVIFLRWNLQDLVWIGCGIIRVREREREKKEKRNGKKEESRTSVWKDRVPYTLSSTLE